MKYIIDQLVKFGVDQQPERFYEEFLENVYPQIIRILLIHNPKQFDLHSYVKFCKDIIKHINNLNFNAIESFIKKSFTENKN